MRVPEIEVRLSGLTESFYPLSHPTDILLALVVLLLGLLLLAVRGTIIVLKPWSTGFWLT